MKCFDVDDYDDDADYKCQKALSNVPTLHLPVVNFINVLRTHFLY